MSSHPYWTWYQKGVSRLFAISKGWADKETYGQIYLTEFQTAAKARKDAKDQNDDHDDISSLEDLTKGHPIDPDMPDPLKLYHQKRRRRAKLKKYVNQNVKLNELVSMTCLLKLQDPISSVF